MAATVIGEAASQVAAQPSAATADGSSLDDNFIVETSGQGIDFPPQDALFVVAFAQAYCLGYNSKQHPNGTCLATQSI